MLDIRKSGKWVREVLGGNPLLEVCETAYLRRQTKNQHPPLFIVGAPRSGSTLLYQLIAYYYRCAYFSNLASVFHVAPAFVTYSTRWLQRPYEDGSFVNDYGLIPGLWSPSEAGAIQRSWFSSVDQVPVERIRDTCFKVAEIMGGPFVWKNLNNSFHLHELGELFPGACFIHIRRDMSYTCQSILLAFSKKNAGVNIRGFHTADLEKNGELVENVVRGVQNINSAIESFMTQYDGPKLAVNYSALCEDHVLLLKQLQKLYQNSGHTLTQRKDFQRLEFKKSTKKRLPAEIWNRIEKTLV